MPKYRKAKKATWTTMASAKAAVFPGSGPPFRLKGLVAAPLIRTAAG
jgi:hypothetical protein